MKGGRFEITINDGGNQQKKLTFHIAKSPNLLCTKRIKCWGGTNALSMSTSAMTIFLASFLKPSRAADAIAITLSTKEITRVTD